MNTHTMQHNATRSLLPPMIVCSRVVSSIVYIATDTMSTKVQAIRKKTNVHDIFLRTAFLDHDGMELKET